MTPISPSRPRDPLDSDPPGSGSESIEPISAYVGPGDTSRPGSKKGLPAVGWVISGVFLALLVSGGILLNKWLNKAAESQIASLQIRPKNADLPIRSTQEVQPAAPLPQSRTSGQTAGEKPLLKIPVNIPEPGLENRENQRAGNDKKTPERGRRKTDEKKFLELMTQGLAAFHDRNYILARSKLIEAAALQPGSQPLAEAMSQVDLAIKLAEIERLQEEAETAASKESWAKALEAYLAALKIDPTVGFALQGKERALTHLKIAKRIAYYLKHPGEVVADRQLQSAIKLLGEAETLQPQGAELASDINTLRGLVTAAQTPVKVTLVSDGQTHVAVYKVGKLGAISSRELQLLPGIYTVVGTRDGYRDIRQKIPVAPGGQPLVITVICSAKI